MNEEQEKKTKEMLELVESYARTIVIEELAINGLIGKQKEECADNVKNARAALVKFAEEN